MLKKVICIGFCLANLVSFAQIGGKSIYQFLNLVTSPRQAALGGKVITFYDSDVNQGHFNPANINPEMDNKLALNYGSYFGEVTYGTASYAYTYDRHVQTFFGGINYVNYGKFDGYDENGQQTSSFTGSEIALTFGYSYNIPGSDFYIGGNAKLINSTLESYSSFGAAIDIGSTTLALYVYDLKNAKLVYESSAMNPQIRFGEDLMSRVSYVMMNKGGDEKLICVPVNETFPYYADVIETSDLPSIIFQQIEHFFTHYKDLEAEKWVRVGKWGDAAEARQITIEAIERYASK